MGRILNSLIVRLFYFDLKSMYISCFIDVGVKPDAIKDLNVTLYVNEIIMIECLLIKSDSLCLI
jgi:hypothetical protein